MKVLAAVSLGPLAAAAAIYGWLDRVLVTHYFNPPHLLPLVEIVPGPDTSDDAVSVVHGLLLKMGKRPAVVQKEVPGFIGNRLQAASKYLTPHRESSGEPSPLLLQRVEQGKLGVKTIDDTV